MLPASKSTACPIAITADSFVVKPLRFPGGSIGELAVNGTMNDLAVAGAKGHSMVVTFVLEEGLPSAVLEAEVRAMSSALRRAGVAMVGGDTKVVERGKADGMYITTAGIGRPLPNLCVDARMRPPGDKVLLSGPIGDHGITILLARGDLELEADLRSDTRCVLPLVEALAEKQPPAFAGCAILRAAVSPLLSTSWRAIADLGSHFSKRRFQCTMPCAARVSCSGWIRCTSQTKGSSSRLSRRSTPTWLSTRSTGRRAARMRCIIGEVRKEPANAVLVSTRYGGSRIVDMLAGDPLPRIC